MPNQRSADKTKVNMWLTKQEKKELEAQAKRHGFSSVTEFVKAVASGTVKVSHNVKLLALSAASAGVGAEQGGCGGLLVLLVVTVAALYMLSC